MKFGLNVVPVHVEALAMFGKRAEEIGFESLWYGEHVATPVNLGQPYPHNGGKLPFSPDSRFLEPFTALSHLAAVTTKVILGTGILIAPLHSPMPLARALTSLDSLSGGRAALGIGVGWMKDEFEIVGQAFGNRGERTDEILEILDLLFTQKRPEFHGKHYDIPPVGFEPKPIQNPRPPFLIGGDSPAALRRAAVYGDGWYGTGSQPETIAETVTELHRLRGLAGRADTPFAISAIVGWGQEYDADLVAAYELAGVDRLIFTPWPRSSRAAAGIEKFALEAKLEAG